MGVVSLETTEEEEGWMVVTSAWEVGLGLLHG